MARRKRKNSGTGKSGAGWSGRLAGVALVAFFVLGYFLGIGSATNAFTRRTLDAANRYSSRLRKESALIRRLPMGKPEQPEPAHTGGPVAMVERHDGFFALYEWGELRGPVSAGAEDNLPIISGRPLEGARAADLVDYARVLVRTEGALAEMISEMRLDDEGVVSLFLDRSRTRVALDLDSASLELERAGRVLRRWRGREGEIASLDMTTPGQAVMRLRVNASASAKGGRAVAARKQGAASAPDTLLAKPAYPGRFAAARGVPIGVVAEAGLR